MPNYFYYRDECSRDYGIYITTPPAIQAPRRSEQTVNVPGRDGTLRIDLGGYEPTAIVYSINFKSKRGETEKHSRGIKAWLLSGRGDYKLCDTYDADYFRIASFSGPTNLDSILNQGGKGQIEFLCHPYKYSHLGQYWNIINPRKEIYNPELFESLPLLRLYGRGNVTFYLNNQAIQVKNLSGHIDIDSEAKQAYKEGVLKNASVIMGEYPALQPGTNQLDWTSGIAKVEILPRWRTL